MNNGLTAHDIQTALEDSLGVHKELSLIAHIGFEALGPVQGEQEAVAGAILAAAGTVIMPAFTYQTQVVPQNGPPDNAMDYGNSDDQNAKAEIFRPDLPVHPDCGSVAETLRQDADTLRSTHPILSFIAQGPNARGALASQTQQNPLGPIAWLEAHEGAVLLMGLDQRHNYSLHLAEQRAGRKTFTRWALTLDDIEELHHIPGCMEGFNDIWVGLMEFASVVQLGLARVELIQIAPMLAYAEERLRADPNFMLCNRPSCRWCHAREV